MKTVERLRRDHALLRSKLDVLEAALGMGPATWYVLREVCFTLARQLRDHIRREEELVAACREAIDPTALAEFAVEHRDEPAHLRTINRLFLSESGQSLERIRPALTEVIRGLRRHMEEEERELFPILERVCGEQAPSAPPEPPMRFDETMTVNRILHECPEAKPVFDQLLISVSLEGCACLDEVAWRHGLEARELLAKLEAVVTSCEYAAPAAARAPESCSGATGGYPAGLAARSNISVSLLLPRSWQ